MTSDRDAVAQAIANVRAARQTAEFPATRISSLEEALEELRDAQAEIADLRAQLDDAVRRVAVRCRGPRCQGRGICYPTDGEEQCLECSGRQT